MASTGMKVATGCGIGCLLLIIILGGIGTCAYVGIRDLKGDADQIAASQQALTARFGAPESYTPDADGRIAPDRIEAFLAARHDLADRSSELHEILVVLDGGEARAWTKVRSVMRLIPMMVAHVGTRNDVLLSHDIGLGEYTYLYALSSYVLLGHDPADGPDFRISGSDGGEGSVRWNFGDEDHGDVRADRDRRARRYLNRMLSQVLANQEAALAAAGTGSDDWAAQLAAESRALREDPERLPWQDGLPGPVANSLAPYREELAAAYDPLLNALEVALIDHD
jgi:hypothetical protein